MKSVAVLLVLALLQLGACSAIPQPASAHQPAKPAAQPSPVRRGSAQPANSGAAAFFELCPQGSDWVRYQDSCYNFNETAEYWYVAEQRCKSHGGHLVSIASRLENAFVGKLTYCQRAWIGRYSVHADRLHESSNYRWTDGTNSNLSAHDFTSISSIHQPLITAENLKWHNNFYHAKAHYVCKVKSPSGGGPPAYICPSGWKYLNGSCYMMPSFAVDFNEATFYCMGRSAYVATVYNAQELRALSLLDLSSDGCPPELWIGLVKSNPCRIDLFSGQKICYYWADRVQTYHNGYPAWHAGHPDTGSLVNCVLLKDRALKTVMCHEKHRFICKKSAAVI